MMFSKKILFTFVVWMVFSLNDGFEDSWFRRKKLGIDPGPQVVATQGEVWPKPQSQITNDRFFIVRPNFFEFQVVGKSCEILEKALERYKQDLKSQDKSRKAAKLLRKEGRRKILINEETFAGYLDVMSVDLRSACEGLPSFDMDEHYELRINTEDFQNQALLTSQSIWGMLRGLETWSHLIYFSPNNNALLVNSTSIMDFPRFLHRGLLIDTSRHFLSMKTIYTILDAMAMSKMNVLHWHIVDDQSFPFESRVFPELSAKGAYAPTHVYSPSDVRSVINYATFRGIRVVPEFDTPGHTRSWGQGYPELLTECYGQGKPDGSLGAVNPILPGTYDFMKQLLQEVKEVFPDSYVHLGGDEVEFECWESNPEIKEFMDTRGLTPKQLEGIYVQKIIEIATNISARSIVWQEVFDDGVKLPNETIVHVWKTGYVNELYDVTRKGYKTILSACWYLDGLSSGGDWQKFYRCDPYRFPGTDSQKRLIIGGEACMWGEVVDVNNVVSRVWPRACATAEKLWSSSEITDIEEAAKRLEEHTCRMNRRKIMAQPPNGPGFCPGVDFA